MSSSDHLIHLLKSMKNHPHIETVLNDLGVSIIDESEIASDDKANPSVIHPDDLPIVERNQMALRQGRDVIPKEVVRIRDRNGDWRELTHKRGVLVRNDDGTPRITMSIDIDLDPLGKNRDIIDRKTWTAGILLSTIEVIISSLNLDDIVQRILEQAKRLLPYDQATIQVLHDGFLEVLGGTGFDDSISYTDIKHPFPDEGSLSTRAIQERRPWRSNDVTQDTLLYNQLPDGAKPIKSWLGVPLIAHGDVIGLLTFSRFIADAFDQMHLELAQAFAGPVAIALENARMHGETYQLAMHDALTGIGSRHSFNLNGKYFFEKAKREGRELAFAMLDLDYFKKINDDFGHLIGDRVLQAVSRTCEHSLRSTDFIARYGGEEIIILFPDTSTERAAKIVARISQGVSSLKIEGVNRPVTLSAGISGVRAVRNKNLDDLIKEADEALYQSKTNGRNRITIHQNFSK